MPFKRTLAKRFAAQVKVPVANEAGGYDENEFTAIFEHADEDELKKLRRLTNLELIQRKLVGWKMVDDETKDDVPFTPEALAVVLLIPPTPLRIAAAFWETINGARAGNS